MISSLESLHALRDCCRDEAAFEKLKQLLAEMLAGQGLEAPASHTDEPGASKRSPSAELKLTNQQLLREIAHCKQVEQSLRESVAKYQELVENANSIILRLDTQGNITFINEFAQIFFGYTEAEILGRSASGTIIPETETSGRNLTTLIQDIILQPEQYRCHENENLRRHKERVWVAWTNQAILDEKGQVIGILCIVNDITERHLAEEALRASESRYRTLSEELELRVQERTSELTQANEQLRKEIQERATVEMALEQERNFVSAVLDTAGALVVVFDQQGGIVRFNKACEQTTGYTFEEVKGSKIWDFLLLPTDVEPIKQFVEQLLTGAFGVCCQMPLPDDLTSHFPQQYENYWVARDGSCRLIAWSNTVLRNQDGVVEYIISIGIDVTERRQVEEALKESKARYKSLYNKTPVLLHSIDAQGQLISVSDYWLEYLGYERSEVIGRKSVEFLTPQSRRYAEEVVLPTYFETGVSKEVPYQFVKKNGEIIDVLLSAIAEKDCSGEMVSSLAVLVDITQRKKAEAALAKSETWFKALIQGSTDMIDVVDREGTYIYVSPSSKLNIGVEPEALIGTSCWDDVHPDDLAVARAAFEKILQNPGEAVQVTVRLLHPDNYWMYLEVSGRNLLDDEAVGGIVLNSRDISERRRAEEREQQLIASLQAAKDQLQAVLDTVPGCVSWIGADLKYQGVNRFLAETFHLSTEDFVGQELGFLDACPQFKDFVVQFFASSEVVASQEMEITVDGSPRHYFLIAQKYLQEKAAVCVSFDITELKQTEEALRFSEEKFAKAFRSCPSSISISTLAEGRYIEVNDSCLRILGYERSEVIGRTVKELNIWVNPEERDRLIQMLQQQKAIYNQELEFRTKAGDIRVGLFSAEIITLEGELCLLGLTNDITERKRAEAQLREAAERERLLAEIALRIRRSLNVDEILNTTVTEVRQFLGTDRVFIAHLDENGHGKVVAESVVPDYPPMLGLITKDKHYLQQLRDFYENNRARVVEDTTQVQFFGKSAEYNTLYQVRAILGVPILVGDKFFGMLIVQQCLEPRHWHPWEVDLLRSLATQMAIAIQQGHLYQQLLDLNANLEQLVQQRTAQLMERNQELFELNQLKDVFLQAVSHDLRNPVTGMLMVLNNLLQKNELERNKDENFPTSDFKLQPSVVPVSRSVLERMIQGNERQLKLINSLLEVHAAREQGIKVECSPVQLSQLVSGIVADVEPILVKNQATLKNLVSDKLPMVSADATQLWRVFENLIINAVNHNPPGVRITLRATVEKANSQPRMIRCAVTDNGVGISPEQCKRLFELYYQGGNSRRLTGFGLGLYLCRQIITAHGGEIGVISSPGKGTTFWFTLPLFF